MKVDAKCWREAITRSLNLLRHIVEQNVILQPSLLKIASFSYSTLVYATESMKYGMSNLKCLSSVLILSVLSVKNDPQGILFFMKGAAIKKCISLSLAGTANVEDNYHSTARGRNCLQRKSLFSVSFGCSLLSGFCWNTHD